ncbi:unnamed protein product [Phytophthora lilii]|uniref:Unnamed protein product n=1 Tax=Phytophthora lilii TaxID=2077276 RepID=A0A9W6U0F1_9STRA|nr:unnamed protein product [Phytophthora lilii]
MFGHHPCIVPFVGASTDTKFPLALVTKYLPYGSLEENLRGSTSLSLDERTGMLKDAAAGLLNIHEGGFIHRDLAARNCLALSSIWHLARSDHPESRKLSLETKLDVRRGALVHVTLEVPNGFEVLNGATQGFAWEGEISSAEYDVVCTDGAAFGRVLFKARITVGSSVAVLNSFVLVGSRALDPSELESDVLEGWMDGLLHSSDLHP